MITVLALPASAQDAGVDPVMSGIMERLDRLEAENARLRAEVDFMRDTQARPVPASAQPHAAVVSAPHGASAASVPTIASGGDGETAGLVGFDSEYGYAILDHAERTNTKPLYQLRAVSAGKLRNRVTLSGGATVLANYQHSNVDDTFGYLMRHPTGANQNGKHVSEAVIHSAQLAVTAQLTDGVTAFSELLYDPQQSFGGGTLTALSRNQIQLRRGWIMLGDLDRTPFYFLIGKMDVPFGLNDTVSPFTNSTNWHAFAGLAYGAAAGYADGGLSLRAMAVQGGAQFRAANAPVNGTSIPSRLNNFAVDGSYEAQLGDLGSARIGASYLHGSAYCQDYPVVHFNPCQARNPAWAAYGTAQIGGLTLLGEFARTTDEWAGTKVPDPTNPLSVFDAVHVTSMTVGGRYGFGTEADDAAQPEFAVSAEFSRFTAGDDGAPWEAQSQLVAGLSWFPASNVNLFGEYVRAEGFVPLNFLSGGNLPGGATWSRQDANTNVFLLGIQGAF